MASIGIHSVAKLLHPSFPSSTHNSNQIIFSPNPVLPISKTTNKIPKRLLSTPINSSNSAVLSPHPNELSMAADSETLKKDGASSQKIDSWVQDSVTDIVKNLKQAPLLVQIYSQNDVVTIQTEKAIEDKWPHVRNEWRSGESKSPDGLIFVEELGQENVDEESGEGVTRAWGIVVQGKESECGPACYLLKTSKVCGGMGLGFCTHFCLMRVTNFRDTALEQFRDSWLLQ
ncbi:hypothetical protein ABFS83_06G060800 [Erythranthe nasuta]